MPQRRPAAVQQLPWRWSREQRWREVRTTTTKMPQWWWLREQRQRDASIANFAGSTSVNDSKSLSMILYD